MQTKKNAIDLTDLALGIVILGIVVAIGSTVLQTYRDAQVTTLPTYSVNGETNNLTAQSGSTTLDVIWGKSVDFCQNISTAIPANAYSYSVNAGTGVITLRNTSSVYNGQNILCNYTVYNVSDTRFVLPDKANLGLGEYGNWFKIIVIVGVAALVLSLIFMSFGKGSMGGGSSEIGGTY